MMIVRHYVFKLHHDSGYTNIHTVATSASRAKKNIADIEHCPLSALVLVDAYPLYYNVEKASDIAPIAYQLP